MGTWVIVHTMGHGRVAGFSTGVDPELGGGITVEVSAIPAPSGIIPGWTRYIGPSAIFDVTPCTREQAETCATLDAIGNGPVDMDVQIAIERAKQPDHVKCPWCGLAAFDSQEALARYKPGEGPSTNCCRSVVYVCPVAGPVPGLTLVRLPEDLPEGIEVGIPF